MIKNRLTVILPVIFLAALVISNGCAKRMSTSQLDETGTASSEPSVEISKPEQRKGEDLIAIAEPLIPSAEVYEDVLSAESVTETPMSSAKYKEIRDIFLILTSMLFVMMRGALQNNASMLKKRTRRRSLSKATVTIGVQMNTTLHLVNAGLNPPNVISPH